MPRPRATSIRAVAHLVFPRYRHDPRYQQEAQICARRKGIKSLYYIRLRQLALERY